MPVVLIVDDDHAVLEMLVDVIGAAGYETRTAHDGWEVLALLEREACDLVLLDVLIPKLNGFDVVQQMRGSAKLHDLPVIMMSGIYRSRNHRTEMTTRMGVIDYLDKPLDTGALLALIKSAIGSPGKPARPVRTAPPADLGTRSASFERLVDAGARAERSLVENAAKSDFDPSAFVMQGGVKTQPVPSVLGRLWHEKRTGALLLRHGKTKKIVYMRGGHPCAMRSNLVRECLGRILVRERLISTSACEASIARLRESGKRQGELLVEMGCITENNLKFALELQAETKLFETFEWTEGEFRFNISAEVPEERSFATPVPALVLEGIRRTFDESRLRQWMLPVIDVPVVLLSKGLDVGMLRLSDAEQSALRVLTSPRSPRSLLTMLPLDPPDALRLVYSLIALELCVPARG